MTTGSILLTRKGMEQLRSEHDNLVNEQQPDILRRLAEARSHGDLSENAEYHAAKERKASIVNRIIQLTTILNQAEIFQPDPKTSNGRCVFGSHVTLQMTTEQEKRHYQLVSSYEADGASGSLSIESPLGQAIVGKVAGDIVEVAAPAGTVEYEIISVSYSS